MTDDNIVDAWCLSLMGARGSVGRVKRLRRERGGIKAMLPKVTKYLMSKKELKEWTVKTK